MSSSTSDPLLSLRAAILAKKPVPTTSTTILTYPKETPTRFLSSTGTPYSLAALYSAWEWKSASGAEYMKQVVPLGSGFVSVTERKSVVDWLEGIVEEHEGIRANQESMNQTTSTKRRYVPDTHDAQVVKKIKLHEVELRDKDSVLRGSKLTNFSGVRQAFNAKLAKLKEAGREVGKPVGAPLAVKKARNNHPIIMISSSPTALITMHNVRKFLQEAVFEPSQEALQKARADGNSHPEDMIPIYRKQTHMDSSGKETVVHTKYFIVNSTDALSKFGGVDAWDRVVCVMTTGQAWQFRPYKWSEPKVLFHHVKGVYVSWSSDPPNVKIKDWNVTELKIDPNRRHVDKSVVAHFWRVLDEWTVANKPWIMKN